MLLVLFINISTGFAADTPGKLEITKIFLAENRISKGKTVRPGNYEALKRIIASIKDPQSKFGYIVFSVARHSEKLLEKDQSAQLDALIESRRKATVNWHDVRNVVRVQAAIAMWNYAAVPTNHSQETARRIAEWEAWTDLRLAYMFEEFVARERFQRAVWDILTLEQRKKIRSGEWDKFLKKSTGHKRLFYADRIVSRAFGLPDHPAALDTAVAHHRNLWKPMRDHYQKAARFERQCEFSMDLADEKFVLATWSDYAKAFRAFATAECESVREILQAGYDTDAKLAKKLDQHLLHLRTEMIAKFRAGAADLLLNLSEIEK